MRFRSFPIPLLAMLAISMLPMAVAAQDRVPPVVAVVQGTAAVKDGDGVLFGRVEIRLQGIAAPEDGVVVEPGGPESSEHLRQLVDGRQIECNLDGTVASSNRPVGVCYVDGVDVGMLQVEAGHARDCPRFSGGRYAGAERRA